MRRLLAASILALLTAGCASSGVIPIDGGVLLLTKGISGPGVSGDGVLADLYKEANAYCAGRPIETVETDTQDPIPFVRTGRARLKFRCGAK